MRPQENMTAPAAWKRDVEGRFQPGTAPGPGRPRGRRNNAASWAAFDRIATEDAVAQVTAAMFDAAKGGDVSAARLVFDRSLPTAASAQPEEEATPQHPLDWSKLSKAELQTMLDLYAKARADQPGGTP